MNKSIADNRPTAEEYEKFIATSATPVEVRRNDDFGRLAHNIASDLVVSRWGLAVRYLLAAAIGYAATLAICAQQSIGLTASSVKTANLMHGLLPAPWCAILCGAIFGGIPFLFSVISLNKFRHRYLLFKMWWLLLLTPLVS